MTQLAQPRPAQLASTPDVLGKVQPQQTRTNQALRAKEAGEYLARLLGRDTPFTPQQMWRMARAGQIPALPLGRSVLFQTEALAAFVEAHMSARSPHGVPATPPLRNCRLGEFSLDSFTLRNGGAEIVANGTNLHLSLVEFTSESLFWLRVSLYFDTPPERCSQDEWIESVWIVIGRWCGQ